MAVVIVMHVADNDAVGGGSALQDPRFREKILQLTHVKDMGYLDTYVSTFTLHTYVKDLTDRYIVMVASDLAE